MTSLGVAARRSVFSKYENKSGYAHLKALEATLDSPQTQNRPAIRAWTEIETEVLSPLVQKVLKNGNAEAELAKAQKKWKASRLRPGVESERHHDKPTQ